MPIVNKTLSQKITPTVTAGAYSAGDVVGGLLTFDSLTSAGGGVTVRAVRIVDDANQKAAMKLYLFDSNPGAIADNAAFTLTAANLETCTARIEIGAGHYETVGSDAIALVQDVSISVAGGGAIYGYLVTNGSTPTYGATDDLSITLVCWVD